jgi:DNA-binding NarL/FixJ family response regulator
VREGVLDGLTAVLLDRQPLWLEAVAPVLERLGMTVLAKATTAQEALAVVEQHRPDMLLATLDLSDGTTEGIECIRKARAHVPDLKAIALSLSDDHDRIEAAFAAGASAYVLKTVHPDDLATALRQAFRTSIYLSGRQPPLRVYAPAERPQVLTERELEIVSLVGEGYSNRELARMLWVTEQTVKFHLTNIYRKLGVSNRTEASRWAHAHGLLPAEQAAQRSQRRVEMTVSARPVDDERSGRARDAAR